MYILTIISSIAGILSFLIAFFDYFKKWQKYLLYFGFLAIGVTGGVLMSMSEKTVQQFTAPQLIYLLALTSILAFSAYFVYKFLNSGEATVGAAIVVLVVIAWVLPKTLNTVQESQDFVKPNDYIILSNYYKSVGDFNRAADCLRKYSQLGDVHLSKAVSDSVDKKVDSLYLKSIGSIK